MSFYIHTYVHLQFEVEISEPPVKHSQRDFYVSCTEGMFEAYFLKILFAYLANKQLKLLSHSKMDPQIVNKLLDRPVL